MFYFAKNCVPDRTGSVPDRIGSDPDRIGSDPDRTGNGSIPAYLHSPHDSLISTWYIFLYFYSQHTCYKVMLETGGLDPRTFHPVV